jgi:hypothetical protein
MVPAQRNNLVFVQHYNPETTVCPIRGGGGAGAFVAGKFTLGIVAPPRGDRVIYTDPLKYVHKTAPMLESFFRKRHNVSSMAKYERQSVIEIVAWAMRQNVSLERGRQIGKIRVIKVSAVREPEFVWVYFEGLSEPMELKLKAHRSH